MTFRTSSFFSLFFLFFVGPSIGRSATEPAVPIAAATAAPPTVSSSVQTEPEPATELKASESIDLGGGVKMELVLIRAGSFQMGSNHNDYDESPAHRVTLTQPYYIGKYEVTQEQWEKIIGENPSHFKSATLPVENVSWEDSQRFVAALQKKTGRRFALPTEAQWEYACRAGTTTSYSFGDDESQLENYAWFASNSELKTHPVGQKKPNPWGLYDVHGNVFEWCADWYMESYPKEDVVDPVGPATGDRRTIRGGAWLYVSDNLRSADRGFSPPEYRVDEYGLRCVMLIGDVVGEKPLSSTENVKPASPAATAAKTPSAETSPTETLLARVATALVQENRDAAESLLVELEKLLPGDPRISDLRGKIATLPKLPETLVIDLGEGGNMEFVLIHAGAFTMGSDQSLAIDEKPAHRVAITRPYYLGKYEVTQKQWVALMGRNLSVFKASPQVPDALNHPVENVSWLLCQAFFDQLNQKVPRHHFRLPTEAEWEYACRAGGTGDLPFGTGATLDDYAWDGANAGNKTHAVGGKKPNAWGLYDMYGNVWEWCQDPFDAYAKEPQTDPTGPINSTSGTRVLRGGAWNNTPDHVTATYRHDAGEDMLLPYYGFRCVAEIAKPR